MKTELNLWLAGKSKVPGVLVASVIHPDKSHLAQVYSESFSGRSLDQIWRNVAQMAVTLNKIDLAAPCLRWLFGDASVYGSARADGICLAVITAKKLSRQETEAVEDLLAEFQAM